MRDPRVTELLSRQGYARVGAFLDPDELDRAGGIFEQAAVALRRPLGDRWFPTSLLPEEDVRRSISTGLGALIAPRLAEVVDPAVLELMRIDLSVKPPSAESELGPHQDFSVVDERTWTSLYLWIPLVDTDAANGTLNVVPGSHRFANPARARQVEARFDDVLDLVEEAAVRLDCCAGELILMVSGVIHFSRANQSGDVRVAAHGMLKPVAAPLLYLYADDITPEGEMEIYEVDMERYIELAMTGRPGPDVPMLECRPRPPTFMSRERFRDGMMAVRGEG